ncbi:phage portal protein [Sphingomonas sp.]|uniref:phage portal protein n=1 Tax=Sphingomonas sp. TaxID=28214 RepID=UPI003B3B86F9
MNGYQLSAQAARQEARWAASREQKAATLESHPSASRQDGDNFRTNRVSLAEYEDSGAAANVIGLSAVWACVNLIAGTIASLPLMVYQQRGDRREVARDHWAYRLLHDSPNADQTAVDFLEFLAGSVELQGNAFARKERVGNRVVSIVPVRPDLVTVRRRPDGSLGYRWTDEGREYDLGQDDVIHVRGFGGGPLGGASTLSVCRATFSGAMATDRAAAAIFRNGVRSTGSLKVNDKLTRDQRNDLEGHLQERFVGALNFGRPMLLDNGMEWVQLSIDPVDAQMVESRKLSVEEICRIFGVPPHMIGHTDNSTSWGTGLEQQTLGFQKFTLRRRLKRFEQTLEKQLLTPQDRVAGISVEFSLEGLLRGDSQARATFYQNMTQIGAMTINEVRALENLPPVPGGDVPRMQMQNVPITQAGTQTAQPTS